MAFLSGVMGSAAGQATGQHDAYLAKVKAVADQKAADEQTRQFNAQNAMQQQQTAQAGQLQQSEIAKNTAIAQAAINEQNRKNIEDGIGLAPWVPPLNHGQSLTLAQKSQNARAEAHYYRVHGAKNQAAEADKQADGLDKNAKDVAAASEKITHDANQMIEFAGKVHNWDENRKIAAQRAAGAVTAQVMRGEITEQVARERIASSMQELLIREGGLDARTNATVGGANARAQAEMQLRASIAQMQQGSANYRAANTPGAQALAGAHGGAPAPIQPRFDVHVKVPKIPQQQPIAPPAVAGANPPKSVQPPVVNKVRHPPPPKPPAVDPKVATDVGHVKQAIAAGVKPADIVKKLNARSDLTEAQKLQIEKTIPGANVDGWGGSGQ